MILAKPLYISIPITILKYYIGCDLMSFNEISKMLDPSRVSEVQVNELATRLVNQNICNTMIDAKEKARSMLQAEKKVINKYGDKREDLTQYNDPRNNPKYK